MYQIFSFSKKNVKFSPVLHQYLLYIKKNYHFKGKIYVTPSPKKNNFVKSISSPIINSTNSRYQKYFSLINDPKNTKVHKCKENNLHNDKNLKFKINTIPNILTFSRILASPFMGYFIIKKKLFCGILLFVYSCWTDLLDGYIARKFNMKSVFGSILDPLADKLLMTTCTLSFAFTGNINTTMACLILSRDFLLIIVSAYYRYLSISSNKSVKIFFDIFNYPTIIVKPNMLGKLSTFLQSLYIGNLILFPSLSESSNMSWFKYFEFCVGGITVLSGFFYIFFRKSIMFFGK